MPLVFTPIWIFHEAILEWELSSFTCQKKKIAASILRLSTWPFELFKCAGSGSCNGSHRLWRPKLLHHAQVKLCIHYSVKTGEKSNVSLGIWAGEPLLRCSSQLLINHSPNTTFWRTSQSSGNSIIIIFFFFFTCKQWFSLLSIFITHAHTSEFVQSFLNPRLFYSNCFSLLSTALFIHCST